MMIFTQQQLDDITSHHFTQQQKDYIKCYKQHIINYKLTVEEQDSHWTMTMWTLSFNKTVQ